MFRSIIILVQIMALTTAALADESKSKAEIGKTIRVPSNTGFSTNVSPDAQAATVLFDNAYVEVNPAQQGAVSTRNQTAIQTKAITLHVPYSSKQESLAMSMDLRGFRSAEAGTSVRLVVCAGDATTVVNLSGKHSKPIKLKGKSKRALTAEHPGTQFGDFQERIEFTVATHAAKPVLQITLFLVAEQDTDTADTGGALLAVDSIDLTIGKQSQGQYK